jgi:hypothetical protein
MCLQLLSHNLHRFFKSIKRLPHPNASRSKTSRQSSAAIFRQKTKSQLPAQQHTASSTSSLSLYRFNFPKPPDASKPQTVNSTQSSHPPLEPWQIRHDDTTKVLRYSGASFDLINPHDSLLLSDVHLATEQLEETTMPDKVTAPAEQEEVSPSSIPRPRRFHTFDEALAGLNRNGWRFPSKTNSTVLTSLSSLRASSEFYRS